MKKSNLIVGVVYVLAGVVCLLAVMLTDTQLDGLLCGLAGGGIGPGCLIIYKYFYWTSPKHSQQYQERIQQEQIELHDEMKEKLRDKSGRYAYLLGLMTISASILVFIGLDELGVIENSTVFVAYLSFYLVFQYIAGVMLFRYLLKKYE